MDLNITNVVSSNIRTLTIPKSSNAVEPGKNLPPAGNAEPSSPPIADLEKTVQQISEFMAENSRGVQFRVDNASGKTVVTVVNRNNGEVIRQIPSEEMLHIAEQFRRLGELHLVDDEI